MDSTTNLQLPYIMPSQAQKSVTHNEALRALDALVMLSVESRSLSVPPADAADGGRYIVAASPMDGWSGQEGRIAAFQDGAWSFFVSREGWLAWCADEAILLCHAAGLWTESGARAGGSQNVPLLGVNAVADATSRLTVSSDASLLTHAGGGHRLVVNKASSVDTASLLFQDGYSGRAEIGLAGDDRLSVKVSADGATFVEALTIDNATGRPAFPQAAFLQDHSINLYGDSGRMAGNGVNDIGVDAFAFPAYLTAYNGSTVMGLAKFATDNSDYGGSAGPLHPQVRDLIDMIRDVGYRRYGVEFWVAEVSMGSGTYGPLSVGAETGFLSLFNTNNLRPPSATFHAYLRALDDAILIGLESGQTALKAGVPQSASFVISPAEGWVSLTVHDSVQSVMSVGYQPNIFIAYARAPGDRYLLACPALIGGITPIDDSVGVLAGFNSWPA